MAGMDQSLVLDGGGLLDDCRLHDITVQAWSPFEAGFFTGMFLGSDDHLELNAVIDRLAAKDDVPAIAIATARITRTRPTSRSSWARRRPNGSPVRLGAPGCR